MRNLTDEELKQVRDVANDLDEKSAEMALLVARLRRACEVAPGMLIDPNTGEWKQEK